MPPSLDAMGFFLAVVLHASLLLSINNGEGVDKLEAPVLSEEAFLFAANCCHNHTRNVTSSRIGSRMSINDITVLMMMVMMPNAATIATVATTSALNCK